MKAKTRLILFSALFFCSAIAAAQTTAGTTGENKLPYPAILQDMQNAHIVQDSSVTRLMQEKIAGVVHGTKEMAGFRVQVYSSNRPAVAKSEAIKVKERLEESITTPIYIISAPPFMNPCYYGTDIDSRDNLIACHHSIEEISKIIGADSLGYLPMESLKEIVGHSNYCCACFNGSYPTEIPSDTRKNRFERKLSEINKIYEWIE